MTAQKLLHILLAIQSLVVEGFYFDTHALVVQVRPRAQRKPRCGECGSMATRVKDRRNRRWRHLDLGGCKVDLEYSIRRVRCESCGLVKTEQVEWAAPSSNFTHAFEERTAFIAQQSSTTFVAKFMRVSWRTVRDIIKRVVARELDSADDRLDGLEHIGIDELSYRKHHQYVTVVVDHARGAVVWASKGKSAATLRRFFEELGPERCEALKSVTIDMSGAYKSAVADCVPNARVIFDRFHVQRLVQDALDETRRDEVRAASTKEEKGALKCTRYALLKSPWNLTAADEETLAELAETNQPLLYAHLLKDVFASALDGRQINVARVRIETWIDQATTSGLPHFVRAAKTVGDHLDGILEYVRTRSSNGRTEGLNGKIRTITRRSFGFHSASALIAMIFLCCGRVDVTPCFSRPASVH